MLTPVEIKGKKFKGTLGYNKKDVDAFMYQVLENYETLYKTNIELDDKNNVLASNLASYKTIESQLEKSLVLAEKVAEETRNNAKDEAEVIIRNAKLEAQKMLMDAKEELRDIRNKITDLKSQYEGYKANVKAVALTQIELMDKSNLVEPETEEEDDKILLEKAFEEAAASEDEDAPVFIDINENGDF